MEFGLIFAILCRRVAEVLRISEHLKIVCPECAICLCKGMIHTPCRVASNSSHANRLFGYIWATVCIYLCSTIWLRSFALQSMLDRFDVVIFSQWYFAFLFSGVVNSLFHRKADRKIHLFLFLKRISI